MQRFRGDSRVKGSCPIFQHRLHTPTGLAIYHNHACWVSQHSQNLLPEVVDQDLDRLWVFIKRQRTPMPANIPCDSSRLSGAKLYVIALLVVWKYSVLPTPMGSSPNRGTAWIAFRKPVIESVPLDGLLQLVCCVCDPVHAIHAQHAPEVAALCVVQQRADPHRQDAVTNTQRHARLAQDLGGEQQHRHKKHCSARARLCWCPKLASTRH